MIAFASDNLITLSSLYDIVSAAFVNNAAVSAVITDQYGATVTTVTLTYIAASDGNYQGLLPASITNTLQIGPLYTTTITATGGGVTFIDRQQHKVSYINT